MLDFELPEALREVLLPREVAPLALPRPPDFFALLDFPADDLLPPVDLPPLRDLFPLDLRPDALPVRDELLDFLLPLLALLAPEVPDFLELLDFEPDDLELLPFAAEVFFEPEALPEFALLLEPDDLPERDLFAERDFAEVPVTSRTLATALPTTALASSVAPGADAAFPARAPITPPTTAPTGPATAPRTAPVAAPAADFETGGMSMLSDDRLSEDWLFCSSAIFNELQLGCSCGGVCPH